MTGAEIVLKKLKQKKIKCVFEYPGGNIAPMLDEIKRDGSIDIILTRNDSAASLMADAYSRIGENIGVCMATVGPGATNLVTGIANAYCDSIPMVAITGQVGTGILKRNRNIRQLGFQETDIVSVVKPITKWAYMVENISELPEVIDRAFYVAKSGRPGPVLIDLPMDIQRGNIDDIDIIETKYEDNKGINSEDIDKVLNKIEKCRRPVILSGGGVLLSGAAEELKNFAEKIRIPVATSLMGLGGFDSKSELSLGFFGCYGSRWANKIIFEADLVIALGVRFDIREIGTIPDKFSVNKEIIHIDIDENEINNRVKSDISIVTDLKPFLQEMNKRIVNMCFGDRRELLNIISDYKKKYSFEKEYFLTHPYEYVRPQYIIKKISEITDGKAIITTDVGQHQMWTAQIYQYRKPYTNLTSGGLGNMGYGLPAAIAAKYANPETEVINITGDGSFQMNLQELGTATAYKLPIKIFIMNNQALGLVRAFQEKTFPGKATSTHLDYNPDFERIAEGYGFKYYKIDNPEDLDFKVEKAIKYKGSVICECIIKRYEEAVPEIEAGHTMDDQYPYNNVGGRL